MESLCFIEANQQWLAGTISEEEYLRHCLQHFCGIRHRDDEEPFRHGTSGGVVANSIRSVALDEEYIQFDDTVILENLYNQIRQDNVAGVQCVVDRIVLQQGLKAPARLINTYAVCEGKARVLSWCIDTYSTAGLEDSIWQNVLLGKEGSSPQTLRVLHRIDWRNMRTSADMFHKLACQALCHGGAAVTWFLEHGAEFLQGDIRAAVQDPHVSAQAIKVVAEAYGAKFFVGSGILQEAARAGNARVVTTLLKAGVDPNEYIPPLPYDRGENATRALFDAVWFERRDVIKVLLKHGAIPDNEGRNNALQLAERQAPKDIVAMLLAATKSESKL